MADFLKAVNKTLIREGGATLTDDPVDRGGLTRYGISQRAFPDEDIRNLTEARARQIYRDHYWVPVQGGQITSQVVAETLFDAAVNMGPRTASRLAQAALDLKPDGVIGPITLKMLNGIDISRFLANYTLTKIARYAHICKKDPSQKRFLLGWINRALGDMT